jgi:hypothetical protein
MQQLRWILTATAILMGAAVATMSMPRSLAADFASCGSGGCACFVENTSCQCSASGGECTASCESGQTSSCKPEVVE